MHVGSLNFLNVPTILQPFYINYDDYIFAWVRRERKRRRKKERRKKKIEGSSKVVSFAVYSIAKLGECLPSINIYFGVYRWYDKNRIFVRANVGLATITLRVNLALFNNPSCPRRLPIASPSIFHSNTSIIRRGRGGPLFPITIPFYPTITSIYGNGGWNFRGKDTRSKVES